MPIKVTDDLEIECTRDELARWTDEYQRRFMFYVGPVPTLAEFIRRERGRKPFHVVSSHND